MASSRVEEVVRRLADDMRNMQRDGSKGTICQLPFEGMVDLFRAAVLAGLELAAKVVEKEAGCNCAPVDIGVGEMHEPYCGSVNPCELASAIRAIAEETK